VVTLGRFSCRSFSSSPSRVACCLSIGWLLLGFGGGLRDVGSGGLRKLGPFSSGRQRVRLSNVSRLVGGVVLASVHLSCQVKAWYASAWANG
jgi:hypothetical protein